MSIQLEERNWINTTSSGYRDPSESTLMFRVLSKFRSGVEFFNKTSITGEVRRPSQMKQHFHKLPQLHKRLKQELTNRENQISDILNMKAVQMDGRILTTKQQNPQFIEKTRIKTCQGKSSTRNETRRNWYRKKYGPVEMKGVVFRKKVVQNSQTIETFLKM